MAALGEMFLDKVGVFPPRYRPALLIPHTLQVTTFGSMRAGARMNLEVDQMARYAARLLQTA